MIQRLQNVSMRVCDGNKKIVIKSHITYYILQFGINANEKILKIL